MDEQDLRAKINRTFLGLEVRITVDHLLNHAGAQLVSPKGRSIDVHPDTVKRYFELCSFIHYYTKQYGKNQDLEELKNKWTAPTRSRYFH